MWLFSSKLSTCCFPFFFGCAFGSIPCPEGDPNVGERCFVKSTLPWRSEATRLVLGDPNGATNISYHLQCFFLHGSFLNTIWFWMIQDTHIHHGNVILYGPDGHDSFFKSHFFSHRSNLNFWIKLVAPGLGLALPPIMMSLGIQIDQFLWRTTDLKHKIPFWDPWSRYIYLPIYHTNRRNPPFISCKYTSPMDFSGIGTDKKGTFIDASIFLFATKSQLLQGIIWSLELFLA